MPQLGPLADEIRNVIAENITLRARLPDTPAAGWLRRVTDDQNNLLRRLLDDPASVHPDELAAMVFEVEAGGRWRIDRYGIDETAAERTRRVELLRRIRGQLDKRPVAALARGSQKSPANSRGKRSPVRRRRQFGGIQTGLPAQGFSVEMSATQEDPCADLARRDLRERKTFAVRLRFARDERKWNQDQLADFLKIRRNEVNRAECAHTWGRPPSQRTRIEWAVALGKPRDWFVPEVEIDERLEQLTTEEEATL